MSRLLALIVLSLTIHVPPVRWSRSPTSSSCSRSTTREVALHRRPAAPAEVQFGATVLRHRGLRLPDQQEGLHDLGRDRPAPQGRLRDRQPHPRPQGRDRQDARATCRPRCAAINARCKKHGIPQPVSFAYPGNAITKDALPVLKDLGITFARRGGAPEYPYKEGRGFAYEPGLDHPLLVPTAGDARPPGRSTTSRRPWRRRGTARSPCSSSTACRTRPTTG